MASNMSIVTILLASFTVSESARFSLERAFELLNTSDAQGWKERASDVADGAQANAIGANAPAVGFSQTLDYVKRANTVDRTTILKVSCESVVFSCEEIPQLLDAAIGGGNEAWWGLYLSRRWVTNAMVFAKGRSNAGCISDPAKAKSIVDAFERKWHNQDWPSGQAGHSFEVEAGRLKQVFIDNDELKPAKGVGHLPVQLETSLRTDSDMRKLQGEMEKLSLIKYPRLSRYILLRSAVFEFESWLKQIRANGEQFSGHQLVTLVHVIPDAVLEEGTAEVVSVLVSILEQYITGVTCREVNQILKRITHPVHTVQEHYFLASLAALKANIVDGYNKVAIVAATSSLGRYGYTGVIKTERLLQDVGVGLPPKNNPVFGLVKGNPVILVVDESTSMDAYFTLRDMTLTRRKFCHRQLEMVLEGLPDDSYFNVIRYSSSTVKIFAEPVLAIKANIDTAMEPVSWRGSFTPGEDPVAMLRAIRVFALGYKHKFHRSNQKKSMEALQMAYAMVDLLPSLWQHSLHAGGAVVMTAVDSPQIYFLTSGSPDGGALQILEKLDKLDKGRNIPVNCIAFMTPDDPAKQFVKDLAKKTGGFFRSIEHAS